ncbi:hypothetical protein PIROE2DRAFT_13838 [Piromyces sp. E2]|nr:hypothetical protein PIROE2DRAFT_13838 [Piromyces sp. E2]|eukprot:OUM60411.1 hypothetical protein PIROE2DRAFT_13838 [Piromyces sp. E2]
MCCQNSFREILPCRVYFVATIGTAFAVIISYPECNINMSTDEGNTALFYADFFKSKKSSDDKIEEYIKNYQLNNFTEDYKEILQNCIIYSLVEGRKSMDDKELD